MILRGKKYRCPVCNEIRERGSYIRVGGSGVLSGMEIKVCLRGICLKIAKTGSGLKEVILCPTNSVKKLKQK